MTIKWSKTPYQRIMEAAHEGRGIRLSASEVGKMSLDSAIFMLAEIAGKEDFRAWEREVERKKAREG